MEKMDMNMTSSSSFEADASGGKAFASGATVFTDPSNQFFGSMYDNPSLYNNNQSVELKCYLVAEKNKNNKKKDNQKKDN